MTEILRMIARGSGLTPTSAQRKAAPNSHKLFSGIGCIAETPAELAVAAALMARPVGQFVEGRGVIGLGGRDCGVPRKASRGGRTIVSVGGR